ncbi:hypothetical protein [Methylocapsa acidiphila]|uniref:hypothetical protein n=1 Tax=Methylocapsa acidiphila TaxID=133552 RepID=UPI00041B6E99|nr:hypothetical protein [Methylocapsa acidiphila]
MRRPAFQGRGFAWGHDAGTALETLRLPLSPVKRSRRLMLRLAGAAFAACGFGAASALLIGERGPASPRAGSAVPPTAPPPAWIETPRAPAHFTLQAPELTGEPKFEEIKHHRTGGGRQDVLVFGGANGGPPRLRITFYQVGDESAPDAAFFVDVARRAAEMGRAIAWMAQPTALKTRLGAFEVASLDLTQSKGVDAACLAFRRIDAKPRLRIVGFACGDAIARPRSELACLIDRIDLAPAVDNDEIVAFFARRELNGETDCIDDSAETPSQMSRIAVRDDQPMQKGQNKSR